MKKNSILLVFLILCGLLASCSSTEPEESSGPILAFEGEILYETRSGDGGSFLALTTENGTCLIPRRFGEISFFSSSWSHDGQMIVYSASRSGLPGYNLYLCDATTLNTRPLITSDYYDNHPAWSPTGEWIAFHSNREHPGSGIYLVRPDGTDERFVQGLNTGYWLSWSPDGGQLYMGHEYNTRVYCLDLASDEVIEYQLGQKALCSPVQRKLVYTNDGVWTFDLETEVHQRLTHSGERPAWSHDGSSVAFLSTDRTSLWTVDTGSLNIIKIAEFPDHTILNPSWQPTGAHLSFSTDLRINGGDRHVYFINMETGVQTVLGENFWGQRPVWCPLH